MIKIKENAYELIRNKITNPMLLDFIMKNQWQEIDYEETPWGIYMTKIWETENEEIYHYFDDYDEIFDFIEEEEEETENIELTHFKKHHKTYLFAVIMLIIWVTAYLIKLVPPLDESDLKYINWLKIDKSIYSYERELTQAKFDLEDTLRIKEKQEKQIESIENSLKELRDKK